MKNSIDFHGLLNKISHKSFTITIPCAKITYKCLSYPKETSGSELEMGVLSYGLAIMQDNGTYLEVYETKDRNSLLNYFGNKGWVIV